MVKEVLETAPNTPYFGGSLFVRAVPLYSTSLPCLPKSYPELVTIPLALTLSAIRKTRYDKNQKFFSFQREQLLRNAFNMLHEARLRPVTVCSVPIVNKSTLTDIF